MSQITPDAGTCHVVAVSLYLYLNHCCSNVAKRVVLWSVRDLPFCGLIQNSKLARQEIY